MISFQCSSHRQFTTQFFYIDSLHNHRCQPLIEKINSNPNTKLKTELINRVATKSMISDTSKTGRSHATPCNAFRLFPNDFFSQFIENTLYVLFGTGVTTLNTQFLRAARIPPPIKSKFRVYRPLASLKVNIGRSYKTFFYTALPLRVNHHIELIVRA